MKYFRSAYEYVKDKLQRYVFPFAKMWAGAAGVPVYSLIIMLLDSLGVSAVGGLYSPLVAAFVSAVLVYAIPNISQE